MVELVLKIQELGLLPEPLLLPLRADVGDGSRLGRLGQCEQLHVATDCSLISIV